ncbi:MAG: UPF0236 family protein [Armatimonadota bacterium]|nr:UPF0236 family protein [Armatimonadota bacterium]
MQLAFPLVHQWMVTVLESLDQELAATREPSLELIRSDVRTFEIVGGPIQFSRRYSRDRATGQYRYLLDELGSVPPGAWWLGATESNIDKIFAGSLPKLWDELANY